jgi:hypothetical protein
VDPLIEQSEKKRHFELDNGNKIIATCENDPYGFWSLYYEKGQNPPEFKGRYTSFNEAHKAAKDYCASNGREIIVVQTNRRTVFEQGKRFEDRYDPPKLETKQVGKHKTVETIVSLEK